MKLFATSFSEAWPLSKLLFSWLDPIVFKARFGKLKWEDLHINKTEEAEYASTLFQKYWQNELKKKNPSLLLALMKSFIVDFLLAGFFKLIWSIFICASAFFFVRSLVAFAADQTIPVWQGWVLAVSFFIACLIISMTFQQMSSKAGQVGIRARAAMLAMVFQKATKLDIQDLHVGDVINYATNDCSRIMESALSFHFLWSGALESMAIIGLLCILAGYSALPALGVMAILLLLQLVFGYAIAALRAKNISTTDKRVSVMSEILQAIKLVKLYAWEDFFAEMVAKIRKREILLMIASSVLKSINLMLVFAVPPMTALVIFYTYRGTQGPLTAVIAFTTLSLFNTLRFPLVVLPKAIRGFAEFLAAVKRLQEFYLKKEMESIEREASSKSSIVMENASFNYLRTENLLNDLNVNIPEGKLCTVVGQVGTGKSNFIMSILGQMHLTKGTSKIGNGRISYVPQNPWCQNGTIRDNILFGLPFDEERYKKVIFACALLTDLQMFSEGDLSELSDRGANLSGGQKQRLALARAAYADADIILLDSPLSAVDQHTCMHIFNHCIKDLFKGKTVILITHHLELLADSDVVGVMNNGTFTYFGEFGSKCVHAVQQQFPSWVYEAEVVEAENAVAPILTNSDSADDIAEVKHEAEEEKKKEEEQVEKQQIEEAMAESKVTSMNETVVELEEIKPEENKQEKKEVEKTLATMPSFSKKKKKKKIGPRCDFLLGWRVWIYEHNYFLVFISLVIFVLTQSIRIVSDRWVGWLTSDFFGWNDQYQYLWTYGCFVAGFAIALLIRGIFFYVIAILGNTTLHNKLFKRVLRAPMLFYNETPVGKVLNCFSKDQDTADEPLTDTLHITIVYLLILLTTMILVCITLPWYSFVAILLFISFFVMYPLYSGAANTLKTKAGTGNSKVFAHLSETLTGLIVIRAFNSGERFRTHNLQLINQTHKAMFNLEQMQLWLSFRLDVVSSVMVFITACFAPIFRGQPGVDASAIGLAISNSFQQLVFYTYVVRGFAEIDSLISCMERINFFAYYTPQEAAANIKETCPTEKWPSQGGVNVEGLYVTYSPDLPPILKNVSLEIKPGEKVGVAGRTGSGKTTLLMTLFRLTEPLKGKIVIDGTDISTLGLTDLRSRISIIPQEPVLFKGTVRTNLDPFEMHDDKDIWEALDCAHLKEAVEAMPNKLQTKVAENGSNFSLGQKQLFCLARAVLNRSKVLVLDEATAALDSETDALIQRTIRKVFADRTIITIAHRLETIIDSDRILVMEAGQMKEYDSPSSLLQDSTSMFSKLVDQTGKHSAAILRKMAQKKRAETTNVQEKPVN